MSQEPEQNPAASQEEGGETLAAVLEKKDEHIPHEIVETEELEGSRVKFRVKVPAETVNERVEEVLKEFVKHAQVPGFRPGKAPKALVRNQFGKRAKDEAVRRMVARLADIVIEESDREALAQPGYDGWTADGDDVIVTVIHEVRPKIAITEDTLKDLSVEVTKTELGEDKVKESLENLQKQNATFEAKDGAVYEDGDGIALKMEAVDEQGNEIPQLTTEIEYTNTPAQQAHPDLLKALEGKKAGETAEAKGVVVSQATDATPELKADLKGTITELKKRVLPELDDEFAKDVSDEFETLDDLKKRIEDELNKQVEDRRRNEALSGVYSLLRERLDFELPPSLVNQLTNRALNRAENELRQYGMTLKKMGREFTNNYVQRAYGDAQIEAQNMLIADEVGRFLDVEVSDEDMQKEFERIGEAQGRKPLAIRAAIEANGRMEDFKADLRIRKVNDVLFEKAEKKEVEPKEEEENAEA